MINAASSDNGTQAVPPSATRMPFPAIRLLYSIGFGVIAWFVFWLVLAVALLQFVVIAIDGKTNGEIKGFSLRLVQYLAELLSFIVFVRDEQPFPIGPFPPTKATSV